MRATVILVLAAAAAAILMTACSQDAPRGQSTGAVKPEAKRTATRTTAGSASSARGFVGDIDAMTTDNRDFRRVVYTGEHLQLVLMALEPGESIGAEVHDVDQFFRVEAGNGEVVINDRRSPIRPDSAIVVPAGARHDITNTGKERLQIYTLYAPPHHRDGVVHPTKPDAERDAEHFDGRTTE